MTARNGEIDNILIADGVGEGVGRRLAATLRPVHAPGEAVTLSFRLAEACFFRRAADAALQRMRKAATIFSVSMRMGLFR